MPLYEYECKTCGTRFEKRVSFSQTDQPQECPACRSNETKKRVSMFASSSGSGSTAASSCGTGSSGRFT